MIETNAGVALNDASECHMLLPVRKTVFLWLLPRAEPSGCTFPIVPKYSILPSWPKATWLGSGSPMRRVSAS